MKIEKKQKSLANNNNYDQNELINKSCLPKISTPQNENKLENNAKEFKTLTPRQVNYQSNQDEFKLSARSDEQSIANCLICFDKPPDAVLMECGHGGEV